MSKPDLSGMKQIGRLALRQEGDYWRAYYAMPDTMIGAIEIGSIAMVAIARQERKDVFMALMREIVADTIEASAGVRPVWGGAQSATATPRDLAAFHDRKAALPADVIALVVAARVVAFEDRGVEAMKALDEASEAFASRVPWEGGPARRVTIAAPNIIGDIGCVWPECDCAAHEDCRRAKGGA